MEKIATPTLIPVIRELPADLETPISVYIKLAGSGPSFLLESVTETGEDTPENPSPSYRNMLRAGFKLAYQRANYVH